MALSALVSGGVLAFTTAPALAVTADFTISPQAPRTNEQVTFVSQATGDPPLTREWDLDGDKVVDASGNEVTHTYKNAGTYNVTLYVNAGDGKAETTKPVVVTEPPPPLPPPPPPPEPSPGNQAPVAGLVLTTGAPLAGSVVRFDASSSRDPDGRIVAYEWDWDGDGRYDANTGVAANAHFLYPDPGSHSVAVRVIDDDGAASIGRLDFTTERPAGCMSRAQVGPFDIAAACLRREGDRYVAETSALSNEVSVNGIALTGPAGRVERIVYDAGRLRFTSSAMFALKINNTPLGDIVLWRGTIDWGLPDITARTAQTAPEGGLRIVTLRAGAGCSTAERTFCARLPGNFPLTGQIDLYATREFQIVVDAWVELSRPFTVRGNVRLRSTPARGLAIDELAFRIRNANLGVFRLENLSFRYQAPPTDTWDAELRVVLPTPTEVGVAGRLRFVRGAFNFLSAELSGVEVPVFPGVFLNRFRGAFGVSPLRIGGGLGARFGPATANANFLFEDTTPAHIRADGNFSLLGQELASARFDFWSNGDLEFGGAFHYQFPPPPAPRDLVIYRVDGDVSGWYQSPRFQVEGGVRLRVWIIDATARVLVNNDWIAGCAGINTPIGRLEAKGGLRLRDGQLDVGIGCDLGPYRIARPRPHAAQAGARTFTLGRGLRGAGIEVRSRTGAPSVTLGGPGGQTFTADAAPGVIVKRGPFTAVRTESDHRLIVRIDRPLPGTWRVTEAAGSPAVTELRTADALPEPEIRARVTGTGARRTLAFRSRRIPGQRIRFLEDGADTAHVIATTTASSGRIVFTPSDGRGRGRRIVAYVEQDGVPRTSLTVGRYTAPAALRPGRPGRVRISRGRAHATVSWGAARGAERYRVLIGGSDGRRELLVSKRRRVVLARVLPKESLTVSVSGERGSDHRAGPARRGRLAAARRAEARL